MSIVDGCVVSVHLLCVYDIYGIVFPDESYQTSKQTNAGTINVRHYLLLFTRWNLLHVAAFIIC